MRMGRSGEMRLWREKKAKEEGEKNIINRKGWDGVSREQEKMRTEWGRRGGKVKMREKSKI